MKNLRLFILLSFLYYIGILPTESKRFIDYDKVWEYIATGFKNNDTKDGYAVLQMKFTGCEMRDGKEYHKMTIIDAIQHNTKDQELSGNHLQLLDDSYKKGTYRLFREEYDESSGIHRLYMYLENTTLFIKDSDDYPTQDPMEMLIYDFSRDVTEFDGLVVSPNHIVYYGTPYIVSGSGIMDINGQEFNFRIMSTKHDTLVRDITVIEGIGPDAKTDGMIGFHMHTKTTDNTNTYYHLNNVYDTQGKIVFPGLGMTAIQELQTDKPQSMRIDNNIITAADAVLISIADISGKTVLTENSQSADVSSLTPGVYIARATTADRQITSLKFTR